MVTGQQPFKGDYDKAVMYSILNEEPEPITAVRAGVPMELEFTVSKCLSKASADRYESAAELAKDLRLQRENLQRAKSRNTQAAAKPRNGGFDESLPRAAQAQVGGLVPKRQLRLFQASAAALALCLGVLSVVYSHSPHPASLPIRSF